MPKTSRFIQTVLNRDLISEPPILLPSFGFVFIKEFYFSSQDTIAQLVKVMPKPSEALFNNKYQTLRCFCTKSIKFNHKLFYSNNVKWRNLCSK